MPKNMDYCHFFRLDFDLYFRAELSRKGVIVAVSIFLEQIESGFHYIVHFGIVLLEFSGVAVLLITAIKSIVGYLKKNPHIRLILAQGIALALEFKLGGEVLRTVIAREQAELITLGAVILLRGALTFLIHWEIKTEESRIE